MLFPKTPNTTVDRKNKTKTNSKKKDNDKENQDIKMYKKKKVR